ncbi:MULTISPECIES: prolyl oligopeptidase family serine peptidase [unclassified Pseudonocardia]|uniref:alpha/beta hydrolase family protein n=1 Tax=unclassified Pseudonocardia TaxID=2619320 RepID=UPI0001FFEB5B|nr:MULTISPECIES: prolyl oligopeptidase family serine peptidase [unclassified Pseudonocardia]OLM17445.1 putative peptidase [Pseudonocardia sp. Ae707_Ps1]
MALPDPIPVEDLFSPHRAPGTRTPVPTTPLTLAARDGRALPSSLTLPVGIEPRGLPTVLLVQDRPWLGPRCGDGAVVQLLANRGYAVLQVGDREPVSVPEDLLDAVDRVVELGHTDPDRVAIAGSSWGGYAALAGVAFTPDRFAAAVAHSGIPNLANYLRSVPEHDDPATAAAWFRHIGDPDDPDQEHAMLARSPVTRVRDIRTPLLIAQGAQDPRVAPAESALVVDALRARRREVEYLVFDDEGHTIEDPENRIALFRAVERFLARHLGGRG